MSTRLGVNAVGLLLSIVVSLAGCQKDAYQITTVPDGASTDGGPKTDADGQVGGGDADGFVGDGGKGDADACVPGVEECNGQDDDCNGKVDDVDPSKLVSDPNNCGACGKVCSFVNAFARCENSQCVLDKCAPGYYDINGNPGDGCEYQCLQTNGGVEVCDNVDNDCDNKVDEDFDLQTDINNCGKCGNRCLYNKAGAQCSGGQCSMGTCDQGFVDLNNDPKDGCEYKCPVWPPTAETCNGQDDDCDGQIDEGLPGAGQACDTGQLGECKAGITQCSNGAISCIAQKTSQPETCDGKDNDCDGQVDEDFALQTNPLHCGQCGRQCTYANATPACVAGQCQLASCNDGYRDLNNNTGDGCEHKCAVFPLSVEKCNGIDDDCDNQIDEDFNLQTDINHCGQCNRRCSFPNAQATCQNGQCVMGQCNTNYYDRNNNPADGCEYFCVPTNGGVEICDNVDNDCNGQIDDGFNLNGDINNCGTCGNVCTFNNASAACVGGQCLLSQCNPGYRNIDTVNANGCEYRCPVWPPTSNDATCDGTDNDCDGQIDEDYASTSCGSNTGQCVAGQTACIGGNPVCQNQVGPAPEQCDNLDNDCDGTVDNGFDKLNDPRTCGPNCTQCSLPNAIANCVNGVCGIAVCANGWVDLDNNPANGCEYQCTPTGVEICDGLDNDCNGLTDTADPALVPLGGNPCIQVGSCSGATATCQGSAGWVCNYNANVQLKPCTSNAQCTSGFCNTAQGVCPGEVIPEETRCDNVDNDCDGLADEPFSNKGQACFEQGKQGICQGSGFYVCNAAQTSTECNITVPGATAQNEICNGKDDDCDGLIDEENNDAAGLGVVDDMVRIQRTYNSVSYDFWIYRYEASRPDATSGAAGANTARSCSKASVIPWANIDQASAQAACAASGKRLCTALEWFLACSGAPVTDPTCNTTPNDGCYYPYGDTYSTTACNGTDNQVNDAVLPTGSKAQCVSQGGIRDMSGNLREWTNDPAYKQCSSNADCNGTCVSGQCSPLELVGHTVRGGSYDTPSVGLRCDFTFVVLPPAFTFPNVGFRCCSDTPP
ncbi:MAG: SUMF1/EgtB/PvdO family nonheme iron enzyme [Myxococcales bacterium]|nr:SUMF1/EgtB/PvdO family nonheme iron enzyme [Myxococcales bacterium]